MNTYPYPDQMAALSRIQRIIWDVLAARDAELPHPGTVDHVLATAEIIHDGFCGRAPADLCVCGLPVSVCNAQIEARAKARMDAMMKGARV